MPYRAALRAADAVLAEPAGAVSRGPTRLVVDLGAVEASVARRLALAVESDIPRRRGRPPLPGTRR